jgi:hypothetical protein
MERFRLRVRHASRRGHVWELHLFPEYPRRQCREADGRVLGSSATPEATLWLRQIAEPFLLRPEAPEPVAAEKFGPKATPRWLRPEDGMRLALAFSAARWLITPHQRQLFRAGLEELPSEVVLYWFTLCFYGYRQAAGRAALRTLLTYEEPEEGSVARSVSRKRRSAPESEPNLFSSHLGREKFPRVFESLPSYVTHSEDNDSASAPPSIRRGATHKGEPVRLRDKV